MWAYREIRGEKISTDRRREEMGLPRDLKEKMWAFRQIGGEKMWAYQEIGGEKMWAYLQIGGEKKWACLEIGERKFGLTEK
jgi:hypothetical protein